MPSARQKNSLLAVGRRLVQLPDTEERRKSREDGKDELLDEMDELEYSEMGMFYLIDEVESEEYSIYEIIDRDNDDVLDRTIKDIIGRI